MRKFTNIFRTKRKNNISLILSALCLLMAASCLSAHESNAVESSLQGHIVDIEHQTVYPGEIKIADGKIADIVRLSDVDASAPYYLPGFIDGHIHIESSMLTPENFARLAVAHGTVGVVADPHEITNVLGETGINFMIDNSASSRLKFHFGLPSCVPSSHLETAGAVIDAVATERLIQNPDIHFLAEMMNYPGVIYENAEVMAKLAAARKHNKPIDGACPGSDRSEPRQVYRRRHFHRPRMLHPRGGARESGQGNDGYSQGRQFSPQLRRACTSDCVCT